ncbi:AraC family transcriptional regulator [Methylobacterium sp. Leaf87]|uniref:helix-turn-helix domain-containing protein n=1 Tax=Methylobacterium sp. Leaf87 TaxID=1736243 RepID=UPI0006FC95D4|nr:AraC family transcriptional regulator [Methylobacterium sp. Leaf87]KQO55295.1 AraC family transcriptional regulator [Methylobacterium sp. Leaf87]
MNEPATLGPLWHVEGPQTFFAGPLAYNASHQHGAPVYLAGLYGRFRIRFPDTDWITCRTAFVPAGLAHELDCGGDPLAMLYLEPEVSPQALTGLMRGACSIVGARVGAGGEINALRALYEDREACAWAGAALADLARFSLRRADETLDRRIAAIVSRLGTHPHPELSAGTLACSVGLSSSRLQHLFTQEIGVPFRRYRAWLRMRRAIATIVAGANFTGAAHAAGFADQAHFANAFRRTFGAPASRSLLGVRR